jgi:hypothetical protein
VTSLVIGIENRSCGDDAVGPEVASHIAQLGLTGVVLADPRGHPRPGARAASRLCAAAP